MIWYGDKLFVRARIEHNEVKLKIGPDESVMAVHIIRSCSPTKQYSRLIAKFVDRFIIANFSEHLTEMVGMLRTYVESRIVIVESSYLTKKPLSVSGPSFFSKI